MNICELKYPLWQLSYPGGDRKSWGKDCAFPAPNAKLQTAENTDSRNQKYKSCFLHEALWKILASKKWSQFGTSWHLP